MSDPFGLDGCADRGNCTQSDASKYDTPSGAADPARLLPGWHNPAGYAAPGIGVPVLATGAHSFLGSVSVSASMRTVGTDVKGASTNLLGQWKLYTQESAGTDAAGVNMSVVIGNPATAGQPTAIVSRPIGRMGPAVVSLVGQFTADATVAGVGISASVGAALPNLAPGSPRLTVTVGERCIAGPACAR